MQPDPQPGGHKRAASTPPTQAGTSPKPPHPAGGRQGPPPSPPAPTCELRSSFFVVELPLSPRLFADRHVPTAVRHLVPTISHHLRRGMLLLHAEILCQLAGSPNGDLPASFSVLNSLRAAASAHVRKDASLGRALERRGGGVTQGLGVWVAAGGAGPPAPLHNGVGPSCKLHAQCIACEAAVPVPGYRAHMEGCRHPVRAAMAPGHEPSRVNGAVPAPPPFTSVERLYPLLSAAAFLLFRTAFSGLRSHYLVTSTVQFVECAFDLPRAQAWAVLLTPPAQLESLGPALLAVLDSRVDSRGWSLRRVRDTLRTASRPVVVRGKARACSTATFTNSELNECVRAALCLRWHMAGCHRDAAATQGTSSVGFPCPVLTPSASWSQVTVNLTAQGAAEVLVLASAMDLWHRVVGPRQLGSAPATSSQAAWCGCVAEARAVQGQGQGSSDDPAAIDAEAELELSDLVGEVAPAPAAAASHGSTKWTSQLLNLQEPAIARLVGRHGAPCGLAVNGGSVFLRFQRTVLLPSAGRVNPDTPAADAHATLPMGDHDLCDRDEAEGDGEGEDEDDGAAGGEPEEQSLFVDLVYRKWLPAPAAASIRSFHDPALSRDTRAFARGAHGLYALEGVPRDWHQGSHAIHAYDLGKLLIAAGVSNEAHTAAADATIARVLSREVGAGSSGCSALHDAQ